MPVERNVKLFSKAPNVMTQLYMQCIALLLLTVDMCRPSTLCCHGNPVPALMRARSVAEPTARELPNTPSKRDELARAPQAQGLVAWVTTACSILSVV